MKFLQSRNFLIGAIGVLVLLIVAGGAWFVFAGSKSMSVVKGQNQDGTSSTDQSHVVGTLKPADIGLTMILRPDNQAIKFTADKLDGVKALEWNFTYDADIPVSDQTADNADQKVTQEFGSDQPVSLKGKTSYSSEFRELGTCSSGHCRYDSGVTKVNLEMKVTKDDGSVYKVEDSISL